MTNSKQNALKILSLAFFLFFIFWSGNIADSARGAAPPASPYKLSAALMTPESDAGSHPPAAPATPAAPSAPSGARSLSPYGVNANAADPFALYDIGAPILTDIYISTTGNDANSGATRDQPVKTIGQAWSRIPAGELTGTGYRLMFLPGAYPCEGDCINYFSDRTGTYQYPVILTAADGAGTVTLLGGLNLKNVSYLYLTDLTLWAGREAGSAFGNNVLHIEDGHHILMRGLTLRGPVDCITDACNDMQEVLKINQADYVYLETSDLSGTFQTVLDYFSVQYGHIFGSRIHRSGGRCAYLKGGSAYFLVSGNDFYDCREAGFQAGEGSNLAFMQTPWLHYETYDVKVVNNVFHDIYGSGFGVHGSYNALVAYNTLYRVGLDDDVGRSWALFDAEQGIRGCTSAEEFGGDVGTRQRCQELLDLGAWGTSVLTSGQWIPNHSAYIYNNIFYNPAGATTHYTQFTVDGPVSPPPETRHIPDPSRTDDNLVVRGNIVWNAPLEYAGLIGTSNGSDPGCAAGNPTCNEAQLLADNHVNIFEPQLTDPAHGDFTPVAGGNVFTSTTYGPPAFVWTDSPQPPPVPQGTLSNDVPMDHDRNARPYTSPPGAYAGPASGSISAGFTASPLSGAAPLAVTFTDASSGPVTGWSWTFGDGGQSSDRSPAHTYSTPGLYTVSLTASGTGAPDTEIKNDYIQVTGVATSLTVTISPQEAIDQGAAWSVDGGDWRASGTTVFGLTVGRHTIAFKPLLDWTAPKSKKVTVKAGKIASTTGTYIRQTGSLKVTLKPSQAVRAGARWRLDSGDWKKSGATLSKIPTGEHTITCNDLTGWTTPEQLTVVISKGKKTTAVRTYAE